MEAGYQQGIYQTKGRAEDQKARNATRAASR
ncbi:hypothetical protein CGRA01v4_00339 [Colletotrichum graminicola]|nr:hypothetical protein CGRA01v4_00339 [Colletotrichum graminicola]